jgi:hypothetical protein
MRFLVRVTPAVRRKFLVNPAARRQFLLKMVVCQQEGLLHLRSLLPTRLAAQLIRLAAWQRAGNVTTAQLGTLKKTQSW